MTLQFSPFSHKIELALAEVNAPHKAYQVDLFNKPEWFTSKVNPVGKVPAVTESKVILEFLVDLYPDSGFSPEDPVSRAKVRFFMDTAHKHLEGPLLDFI
ncbi:hypothetical protein P692DRAFT_20877434 [Suillus brevipes Sb2]|nr:hypothetical protein P692DRAFT_20877434 [Suillus brevipes Sb2]